MSIADELEKLNRLRLSGALNDAEFEQQKRELLRDHRSAAPSEHPAAFSDWKSVPLTNRRWFQGLLMLLTGPIGIGIAILKPSFIKRRGEVVRVGRFSRTLQVLASVVWWLGLAALLWGVQQRKPTGGEEAAQQSQAGASQSDDAADTKDAPQLRFEADQRCSSCAMVYRLTMVAGTAPVTLQKINLNDRPNCNITNFDVGKPLIRVSDQERARVESGMSDFGKGMVEDIAVKAGESVPRILQVGDAYEFRLPREVESPFISAGVWTDCGSALAKVTVYTNRGSFAWNVTDQAQ